jgi:hypothetical protein
VTRFLQYLKKFPLKDKSEDPKSSEGSNKTPTD